MGRILAKTNKEGYPLFIAGNLSVVLYDDHLKWEKVIMGKEIANIYYSDILSVSYTNGDFFTNAYISVSTAGRNYTAKMTCAYDNINIIAEAIEAKRHQNRKTQSSNTPAQPTISSAIVDELKQYKELLDTGIISQEEFDAKKKVLLSASDNETSKPTNVQSAPEQTSNVNTTSNSSEGCYVATAVYGSYDCPQVWTLRRFRDYTLAKTWYGRTFIRTYYAISPTLVKWFGHTGWFKKMWKGKLDRMVANLNHSGVEDTPYEDHAW